MFFQKSFILKFLMRSLLLVPPQNCGSRIANNSNYRCILLILDNIIFIMLMNVAIATTWTNTCDALSLVPSRGAQVLSTSTQGSYSLTVKDKRNQSYW